MFLPAASAVLKCWWFFNYISKAMILFYRCLPERAEVACKRNRRSLFMLKRLCDLWLKKIPRKWRVAARHDRSCSTPLRPCKLELPHAWQPSGEFPHWNSLTGWNWEHEAANGAQWDCHTQDGMHAHMDSGDSPVFAEKLICGVLYGSWCYSTKWWLQSNWIVEKPSWSLIWLLNY